MPAMPVLKKLAVRDLKKRYGPVTALTPTNLDVAEGEFLTLLGPSGSGKTTLLMMIAGLTAPSGGSLFLDGAEITARPAYRRDIGVVIQNYALFPHLSVFENVAFPLRMRKLAEPAIAKAVREALALVQLAHLDDRLPRELSGGQQQRVAFARAIVFKPSLVLMDEPLGALDKKLRDELKLEIRKLHRELGATILYVTHDQEEAMLLSDRICLMNNARIEQIDTPLGLYDRPATRFAATFIGESNLLSGHVSEHGIEIAGLTLTTSHLDRLPEQGAACTVLIRPERIALAPMAASPNQLQGRIESVIDLGGTRRLAIRIASDLLVSAVTLGGGRSLSLGETVILGIDPTDVVPLREEA